jgi:D-psicose/D-tagatose/L-ribulose 3-epimerase
MKIGICAGFEKLNMLEEIGYDFLEGSTRGVVSMDSEEFQQLEKNVKECRIKCEVCNLFLPSTIKLTGPDTDEKVLDEYLKIAFERLSKISTELVVVGSGGSREIPDGWQREKGLEQLTEAMRKIGQKGAEHGIVVTLEHLPDTSTNTINTIKEGLEFLKVANHPNLKMMTDYGHAIKMKEDINVLYEAGSELMHVHIRNSNNNRFPLDRNEEDYLGFFNILKQIGYDNRISIEAGTKDMKKDACNSLKFLKELISEVWG